VPLSRKKLNIMKNNFQYNLCSDCVTLYIFALRLIFWINSKIGRFAILLVSFQIIKKIDINEIREKLKKYKNNDQDNNNKL